MITGFVYVHKHSTVSLLDHDISENRTFVHFETNSVLKKCFINVKIVNNFNLKPEKDECVKPKLTFSPFKSTRPNQYITGLINISEGSLLLHLAEHAPHVLYKGSGLATVASFAAWCPPLFVALPPCHYQNKSKKMMRAKKTSLVKSMRAPKKTDILCTFTSL